MYKEGCHPLFLYTQDEKQKIREELGLKESSVEDDIDSILEWFEKQPHLIGSGLPERAIVENMLICAKGSREKTKRRIDGLFKHRALAPELIQNRLEHLDKEMWTFYMQAAMPKLYELKRITVIQICDPDPNSIDIKTLCRNTIMLADIRLRYDYMFGDIWVIDLTKASIGHLLRVNLVLVQKMANLSEEGYGNRVFVVHILRAPAPAQQIVTFFNQCVKAKIMNRILFHNSLEELHQHVPKKYLPKDYGGEEPSMEEFKETYMKILRTKESKQVLTEASSHISDESKRPDALIQEDYLQGSFKKLDLD